MAGSGRIKDGKDDLLNNYYIPNLQVTTLIFGTHTVLILRINYMNMKHKLERFFPFLFFILIIGKINAQ